MADIATPGDIAHVHLLINHFPTIGTILGLLLLLLSFARKNEHLRKVSFEVFFLIALSTIPVYQSGVAAAEQFKTQPALQPAILLHQDVALQSFILMEITGFLSWLALWRMRRIGRATSGLTGAVLLFSVLTMAVVALAANLGGDIHHPEILQSEYSSPVAPTSLVLISATTVQKFVLQNRWVWPTCETLHFLGMSLMFGVLMIVNLRLLGFMKAIPFAAVHRLLPYGILGYGVNFFTGMLFFIGEAGQYTENVAFHYKMILMMLAGANFLVLTVYDGAWKLPAGADAPMLGKLLGASALLLSIGVMYFGRMLPFIGNAF
jgi:uncharacterized membrane protein